MHVLSLQCLITVLQINKRKCNIYQVDKTIYDGHAPQS